MVGADQAAGEERLECPLGGVEPFAEVDSTHEGLERGGQEGGSLGTAGLEPTPTEAQISIERKIVGK